ncbi:SpoIIE family protein phosphatase [Streptomyces sp. NPDC051940]|uniref:SpoIIE family protein phosphatase n=1 Tax=Streptomyces sp. NPDC051940 TaxID=3155675 RepID=UPI003444F9C6
MSTPLPGTVEAASVARGFVRAALADWKASGPGTALTPCLVDDALLLMSELVTNAVVHAGTDIEVRLRLDPGTGAPPAPGMPPGPGLIGEVADLNPTRTVRSAAEWARGAGEQPDPDDAVRRGRGLRLVTELAESWGVVYRRTGKTVWFRLALWEGPPEESGAMPRVVAPRRPQGPAPVHSYAADTAAVRWHGQGAYSFLAETSDILTGQFDEDMVASLATQLLVPRFADWSAIWLDGEVGGVTRRRLAQVWHAQESRLTDLRRTLQQHPPTPPGGERAAVVPCPWPGEPGEQTAYGPGGTAVACRLRAGGRELGMLALGRAGLTGMPDDASGVIEDFARRVAHAVAAARRFTRQATISAVLQRGLLPHGVTQPPGTDVHVVYEPADHAWAGGDFWDLFPVGDGRWCFALGDVCGNGPEAAVVTGLARPVVRLLAREGYGVAEVLRRLNRTLAEEAVEAVEAAAAAVSGHAPSAPSAPDAAKFLSLLYGELLPYGPERGGARCTLASAGHPLPMVLRPDGTVRVAASPQMLLGVVEDATYEAESFDLSLGDTLLCVTDGVTERRSGDRLFDDGDGLASVLAGCAGLTAAGVAERVRRAVHAFGASAPEDDLAMLVMRAV